MSSSSDLERRLGAIESRNARVGSDKAWETSWTRRVCIAALTYVVVVIYLFAVNNDAPFINGLVPVGGYLLSTLALKGVKTVWVRRIFEKNK